MPEPYLVIKKPKPEKYTPQRKPKFQKEDEGLTGEINNIDAAEGEERFSRTLYKNKIPFVFRVNPTGVPKGMPGWLELDFLVQTRFGVRAFEVDDMTFVHKGQRAKMEAKLKDMRRLEGLNKKGYNVQKIEHIDNALLLEQDSADKLGEELFG